MAWSDELANLHADVLEQFGGTVLLIRHSASTLNVSDGTVSNTRTTASVSAELHEEVFERRPAGGGRTAARVGRRRFGFRMSDLESEFGEGVLPGLDGRAWEIAATDEQQTKTYEVIPDSVDASRATSTGWVYVVGTRKA